MDFFIWLNDLNEREHLLFRFFHLEKFYVIAV